jgi:hypothetical protein
MIASSHAFPPTAFVAHPILGGLHQTIMEVKKTTDLECVRRLGGRWVNWIFARTSGLEKSV